MGSTAVTSGGTKRSGLTIVVTSLALFSMFFGAGNLIFPPMLAVQAGDNFWPAILGFLGTGALLPVLAVIAIALAGEDVRDLAQRAGTVFGLLFPILAYLSIGAFYALPRTGAVSMETAITPLLGVQGTAASAIFNIVFFGIALALSWNPIRIMDTLGKFLVPALVVLLVIMIAVSLTRFDAQAAAPAAEYAESAFTAGLLEGYLTMDSIAALAFAIVVISTLSNKGYHGRELVNGTIIAGIGAGIMLALIYLGLGGIGRVIPNGAQYENGAGLLAEASNLTMGNIGQIVFSLVVLLACLTTAVGLITATSEYFHDQFFGSYRMWAIIFTVWSMVFATQGLSFIMTIAAPVIGFLYPPAIALILVTLIEPAFRSKTRFTWALIIPVWTAVVYSLIETFIGQGWGASALEPIISWTPLFGAGLGWVVPVAIAFIIGLVLDFMNPKPARELGEVR
ncbi:branched-chain amino acid transport system II carrier protein [Corynebacterium aquatimens]|uniref:branched-chain amino acid transport system II carrier protein n=1 Tax=Corynebacterium TaxID=1716 RepID=UPI001F347C03|nr:MULTISPECIES: branched-chain amino acid transport system II carrier protein [Corynebacterium]QYH19372.1 branched-chain amino acid transport system II carrier protein [Corynebacterium aquatimens]UIZ91717.1 branched-chain amino acid transport system II carrier protein [Corynebacterium sp. CNCTC7651]